MDRKELEEQLNAVIMEKRSFMESIENGTVEFNKEEADAKIADFEARSTKIKKELAEMERPMEKETRSNVWAQIAEGMQKRTPVSINGTGVVNTLKELVKAVQKDNSILNGARFFYGPNAATNIPVWASHVTAAFVAENGSATAQNKALAATSVTPKQAMCSLPVSKMTLDLSAVEFEAELPGIFNVGFGDLMAQEMLTGDGTNMQGIFTDTGATGFTAAITVAKLAELALSVKEKKYANPVIVMSSAIYGQFMADASTDETTKIYKESLIRDKTIEGVKVIISGYAPVAHASSDVIAVAGDLANYAIGVAGELNIEPKGTAGASYTTYDAIQYFSGKPVISADFVRYIVA